MRAQNVKRWETENVDIADYISDSIILIDSDAIVTHNDINMTKLLIFNEFSDLIMPVKYLTNANKCGLFGIIMEDSVCGLLLLNWKTNNIVFDDDNEQLCCNTTIYGRGKFANPISLQNVKTNVSNVGIRSIAEMDNDIYNHKLKPFVKNDSELNIGFINKKLKLFVSADMKQIRVYSGFCQGRGNFHCVHCLDEYPDDQKFPTVATRCFTPRSLQMNKQWATQAIRKYAFNGKQPSNRYIATKGIKFPPIFDLDAANVAISVLHIVAGTTGKISGAAKKVLMGDLEIDKNAKLLEIVEIQKQLYYCESELLFYQVIKNILKQGEYQDQSKEISLDELIKQIESIRDEDIQTQSKSPQTITLVRKKKKRKSSMSSKKTTLVRPTKTQKSSKTNNTDSNKQTTTTTLIRPKKKSPTTTLIRPKKKSTTTTLIRPKKKSPTTNTDSNHSLNKTTTTTLITTKKKSTTTNTESNNSNQCQMVNLNNDVKFESNLNNDVIDLGDACDTDAQEVNRRNMLPLSDSESSSNESDISNSHSSQMNTPVLSDVGTTTPAETSDPSTINESDEQSPPHNSISEFKRQEAPPNNSTSESSDSNKPPDNNLYFYMIGPQNHPMLETEWNQWREQQFPQIGINITESESNTNNDTTNWNKLSDDSDITPSNTVSNNNNSHHMMEVTESVQNDVSIKTETINNIQSDQTPDATEMISQPTVKFGKIEIDDDEDYENDHNNGNDIEHKTPEDINKNDSVPDESNDNNTNDFKIDMIRYRSRRNRLENDSNDNNNNNNNNNNDNNNENNNNNNNNNNNENNNDIEMNSVPVCLGLNVSQFRNYVDNNDGRNCESDSDASVDSMRQLGQAEVMPDLFESHSDNIEVKNQKQINVDPGATCNEKIQFYQGRIQILKVQLQTLNDNCVDAQGLQKWNDLMEEMKVREISWRGNEMTGTHSLNFLNSSDKLVAVLKDVNEEIADVLDKLLHFRKFIVHSFCHKNRVRYTDDFLRLLLFAIVMDDHLTHLYLKLCHPKSPKLAVGQKHHSFYHIWWWMDHYRFSPAWLDDQKSENMMKLLKRMFRTFTFSLNQSKLKNLVHQMNMYHFLRWDVNNYCDK